MTRLSAVERAAALSGESSHSVSANGSMSFWFERARELRAYQVAALTRATFSDACAFTLFPKGLKISCVMEVWVTKNGS